MEGLLFHGSRWALYTQVGCTPEVYVRPFPAAAGIWRISNAGETARYICFQRLYGNVLKRLDESTSFTR